MTFKVTLCNILERAGEGCPLWQDRGKWGNVCFYKKLKMCVDICSPYQLPVTGRLGIKVYL